MINIYDHKIGIVIQKIESRFYQNNSHHSGNINCSEIQAFIISESDLELENNILIGWEHVVGMSLIQRKIKLSFLEIVAEKEIFKRPLKSFIEIR